MKKPVTAAERVVPFLDVTFKDIAASDAVASLIRIEAEKLERFFPGITRCRVVVEVPHRHRLRDPSCSVRIELDVPQTQIVVNSGPTKHTEIMRTQKSDEFDVAHKYVQLAVQDAFRKAGRRLQDYARRLGGTVKVHEPAPVGEVSVLRSDYGFLRTSEDRNVYFHRNSVLHDAFDRLHVGSKVRFVEEEGDNGPQASTVTLVS